MSKPDTNCVVLRIFNDPLDASKGVRHQFAPKLCDAAVYSLRRRFAAQRFDWDSDTNEIFIK